MMRGALIRVDKQRIAENAKNNKNDPPIVIHRGYKTEWTDRIDIVHEGEVVASVVYDKENPRHGAVCWIETKEALAYKTFDSTASYGFIGGGHNNSINLVDVAKGGGYSVIKGGYECSIGDSSGGRVIGGGKSSNIDESKATIVGGTSNKASGIYGFIGGGQQCSIETDPYLIVEADEKEADMEKK